MTKTPDIICVVPARLASSRFPEKIVHPLLGKPLLQWVGEKALKVPFFKRVIFAIDDPKTIPIVERFGGEWVMTSKLHTSGTQRIIEVMQKGTIKGDIWVNWQADEPLLEEEIIRTLLIDVLPLSRHEHQGEGREADIWTLRTPIRNEEDFMNPNRVKVVSDRRGFALYFSRSPIPYFRGRNTSTFLRSLKGDTEVDLAESSKEGKNAYQHIGLYAYTSNALEEIALLPPSFLEEAESLEQLRFLEGGLSIRVHTTQHHPQGVDTLQDLENVEKILKKR